MAKSRRRKRRRRAPGGHQAPKLPVSGASATERSSSRAAAERRASREERPPAPWGSFPLVEIAVLVGLVMLVVGFVRQDPLTVGVGLALGSLAGLELSVREHFAGYRSHTTLLAGTVFVTTVAGLYYAAGLILLVFVVLRGMESSPNTPRSVTQGVTVEGSPDAMVVTGDGNDIRKHEGGGNDE